MHINSLVWDRIFEDPEFGGLLPIQKDRFGPLYKHETCTDDEKIVSIYYRIRSTTRDIRTSRRGIYVNVPHEQIWNPTIPSTSLKTLSALTMIETWGNEFYTIIDEMKEEMKRMKEETKRAREEVKEEVRERVYKSAKYLQRISRDAMDSISLYHIDLNRMDRCLLVNYKNDYIRGPQFYSEHFSLVYVNFEIILRELYAHHNLDSLKRFIERAWDLIVKIFQIHHELAYSLSKVFKNPIRPMYYSIHRSLRERILTHAKYHPI